ncbi:MAG: GntR family transcriptional regulator [Clostridia bacterium]|jgi:DNA-binding GntR family transcriptional regulator|nr:GntR family transcriptional regulator [Clostridia bacterium]
MIASLAEISISTKTAAIYQLLKEEILSGNIKDGERLIIREIAKKNRISDSPVREAIKALESEGLVQIIPHVGARVMGNSIKNLEDTLAIREYLEPFVMQLAIENASESIKEKLKEHLLELKSAYASKDANKYSIANRKFHDVFYEAVDNQQLIKIMKNLYDSEKRSLALFQIYPGLLEISLKEHEQICQLYIEENKEAFLALTLQHKKRHFNTLREYCQKAKPQYQ